ncbi:MAG: hypothetical protein J7L39_01740, partial [Candidatus Aenigmarchaeota archaeon]|nr:hypothetical protein [Candidatus Aenigmarchaeota archaeon]
VKEYYCRISTTTGYQGVETTTYEWVPKIFDCNPTGFKFEDVTLNSTKCMEDGYTFEECIEVDFVDKLLEKCFPQYKCTEEDKSEECTKKMEEFMDKVLTLYENEGDEDTSCGYAGEKPPLKFEAYANNVEIYPFKIHKTNFWSSTNSIKLVDTTLTKSDCSDEWGRCVAKFVLEKINESVGGDGNLTKRMYFYPMSVITNLRENAITGKAEPVLACSKEEWWDIFDGNTKFDAVIIRSDISKQKEYYEDFKSTDFQYNYCIQNKAKDEDKDRYQCVLWTTAGEMILSVVIPGSGVVGFAGDLVADAAFGGIQALCDIIGFESHFWPNNQW